MSTLPAVTDSIPAEDPVNSAVTVTDGYFSINASAAALASFSIDVEPAIVTVPAISFPSACSSSVVSSAVVSSACVSVAASGVLCVSSVAV